MRRPSIPRRLGLILATGALGWAGCNARPMAAVGFSPPRAMERTEPALHAGALEPSVVSSDFRSHMARATGPFVSRGHGERFDAVVWVNATAQAALEARRPMEDGALLIEETTVPDARGEQPTGLLVMQRRLGAWAFSALGPDGVSVTDARVVSCGTCHGDAPDGVFLPLPR